MKTQQLKLTILLILFGITASCRKHVETDPIVQVSAQEVIEGIAQGVTFSVYQNLQLNSELLQSAVEEFISSPSANGLIICREKWKATRSSWEQSEAFIYGPVATESIDPKIDSWPVDFGEITTLLGGTMDFSQSANIASLNNSVKGFHAIEFLLWGENGQKDFTAFTAREFEFLLALSIDLTANSAFLVNCWNPQNPNSYYPKFTNPSSQNEYYLTKREVFEEILFAMIGICEELQSGKIGDPFYLQDPGLEESSFSSNSLIDFQNNIRSIEMVYLGNYSPNGLGLNNLVRQHTLSLDNQIKYKLNNAKSALIAINGTFREALFTQPGQIIQAISAIEELKNCLENELLPFIQIHSNE